MFAKTARRDRLASVMLLVLRGAGSEADGGKQWRGRAATAATPGPGDSPPRPTGTVPRVAEQYPWERPLGASVVDDALVEFRTWAPAAQRVAVRVRGA
jgi:hypothetical protein